MAELRFRIEQRPEKGAPMHYLQHKDDEKGWTDCYWSDENGETDKVVKATSEIAINSVIASMLKDPRTIYYYWENDEHVFGQRR